MSVSRFNANECKVQLKLGASRMQLQKNKKVNIIKNLKREIAQLLASGREEGARIKTEVIIREDFLIDAYEILELFCETLVTRITWLAAQEQCPLELKEAVCTIIYAASRVEIKELTLARAHLIAKFGKPFGLEATQNSTNCVNPRIIHKLRIQPPETLLVLQYMADISKAHNVDWKADELILREEQHLQLQQQQIPLPLSLPVPSPSPLPLPSQQLQHSLQPQLQHYHQHLSSASPSPSGSSPASSSSPEPLPSDLQSRRLENCPMCNGQGHITSNSGIGSLGNGNIGGSSGNVGVLTPPEKSQLSVTEFERLFASLPQSPQPSSAPSPYAPNPTSAQIPTPTSVNPPYQPYSAPSNLPTPGGEGGGHPSFLHPPSAPASAAVIAERFTGLAAPGGIPLDAFASAFPSVQNNRGLGGSMGGSVDPFSSNFSRGGNGRETSTEIDEGSINPFTTDFGMTSAPPSSAHLPSLPYSSPVVGSPLPPASSSPASSSAALPPTTAHSLGFPPSTSGGAGMGVSVDLTTSMPDFDELAARFEALKRGQFP